ncbi:MAG: TonB-dependent receptor, partial [Hyphomicrobiaceae bacterium]
MRNVRPIRQDALISTSGWRGLSALLLAIAILVAAGQRLPASANSDWDDTGVSCSQDGCTYAEDREDSENNSRPAGTPFTTYTDKGAVPFSISVDGEPLIGSSPPPGSKAAGFKGEEFLDDETPIEPGIEGVDIHVKFDGLQVQPALNVSTKPIRASYEAGEVVTFYTSSNYPDWIRLAEVRVFRRGGSSDDPDVKVLPVNETGEVEWTVPENGAESFRAYRDTGPDGNLLGDGNVTGDVAAGIADAKGNTVEPDGDEAEVEDPNPDTGAGNYEYVLRVYDSFGNYDETAPLSLTRTSFRGTAPHSPQEPTEAPGYGEDRTGIRNITLSGGAVTVHGRNIPRGYKVHAFGEEIPVDREGAFVSQRILPAGEHDVDVLVSGGETDTLSFTRHVNIPSNDWFYVALADLTVGRRFQAQSILRAREGEFEKVYSRGRAAFYLKGKIQGKYLLTAAADSGEDDLENLIKGLDDKDPRQFLRRLDPDDFYPVYGDDSTLVEDAPTRGKFFVRIARGPSHAMWGNFKTRITGTTFLRNERALYGAQGVYRSQDATYFGEAESEVRVYAAQPRTLPQRDVLQGTGGSAYFLKRQDITAGSETVTVEVRDTVTDRVINRYTLKFGQDYEIDYVQGVVILKAPLNSFTGGTDIVQDGTLSGERLNLVVQYEYTPGLTDVSGFSYGARAHRWFMDRVRIGATAMREKSLGTDVEMAGADIQLRYSERTFIEGEVAQSKGIGLRRSLSTDGGLIIVDEPAAGTPKNRALGLKLRGQIALEELLFDKMRGTIGGYYEELDAGFSTLDRSALSDEKTWGLQIETDKQKKISVAAKYDDYTSEAGTIRREGNLDVNLRLYNDLTLGVGGKHTRLSGSSSQTGSRTDLGLRLTKAFTEDRSAYVFGQRTLSRSGTVSNNN